MEFPRIIHQIWLQGLVDLPEKYLNNVNQIKNYNPNFEHILWDEIQILEMFKSEPQLLKVYYKLLYLHQKVDFARYVILYKYGGIYIDIDVEPVRALENLFREFNQYDLIVSFSNTDRLESYYLCQKSKCVNNGIIITKPENNVILQIIDYIKKNPSYPVMSTKMSCINDTTGPNMFSHIILKNLNTSRIKILDNDYLEPCTFEGCKVTENTYLMHKLDCTWCYGGLRDIGKLYYDYKNYLSYIVSLILFIIIVLCIFSCIFMLRKNHTKLY